MGKRHAGAYGQMPDVELYYLLRNDEGFASSFNATAVTSLDELFAVVDVVDVCVPTDAHVEVGLSAIASGTPVFMEKPIARTLDSAIELMEAARRQNVPMMIGQVVRFFPEYVAAHNLVKDGGIGTPAAARLRRGGGAPSGWFMDHARSGGVLVDLAIHDFDWLRWTLGEVKHVFSRSIKSHTGSGPDYALTTLTFDSGAIAHVESTWMDPSGFRTTLEVAGSGGLIQHDSRNTAILRSNTERGSSSEQSLNSTDDPYYLELHAFLESVRNGTEVPVSAHEGIMALSVSLAALQSAQTGETVSPVRI